MLSILSSIGINGHDRRVVPTAQATLTWSAPVVISTLIQDFRRGAVGNGYLVISRNNGDPGACRYSTDNGVTWTSVNLNASGGRGIAFGNNIFIVPRSSIAVTRIDATAIPPTITTVSLGTGNSLFSVAYGNGIWVGINLTRALRSIDNGVTWSQTSFNFPNATDIAFGDGIFVVSATGSDFYKSSDGITWETITVPTGQYNRIIYHKTVFVAAAPTRILTLLGTDTSIQTNTAITTNITYIDRLTTDLDMVSEGDHVIIVGGRTTTAPRAVTIVFSINPIRVSVTQHDFDTPFELVLSNPANSTFMAFSNTNLIRTAPWISE